MSEQLRDAASPTARISLTGAASVYEVWLSIEKVCELTGLTERHVRRKFAARPSKSRNRNGKHEREYLLSSLPSAAQLKYAEQQLCTRMDSSLAVRATQETAPLFANAPEPAPEPVRTVVPEHLREQVASRFDAIKPLLDFKARTNGKRPKIRLFSGKVISNLNELAAYVAAQQRPPVSTRTLWRWYSIFNESGYAALGDRPRADKGKSRLLEDHPAARFFIENKWCNEGVSFTLAYEALLREWPRLAKRGAPKPSYTAVRNYLRSLPRALPILAREGEKAFDDRCAPYVIRGPVEVMASWISDHGQHDVWVRNDLWPELAPDAALRPWLTAMMDHGSRKIVGSVWCPTPSSHSISSALRRGITEHGSPRTLYIDNGKDYRKIGKIGISPEAQGVLDRLKIRAVYCIPRHPQSKPIESWFATVRKRFDCLWKPVYCGRSPALRPESCVQALKQHEQFLKGKLPSSPLPLASEFVALASAWVDEYNATHAHTGRGMNGRTPDQVFDEAIPESRRMLADPRALDALFWDRVKRRVSEGGCVQLEYERYEPGDPESLGALFLKIGDDIWIARDPYDLGQAIALDADGRYIGRLQAQKLLAQGPVSHDAIRASLRERRQLKRAVKDYLAHLANANRAAGFPSELEALRERAALRTGTDGSPRGFTASGKLALPEGAAPGAAVRRMPALPEPKEFDSPFVDDAVAKLLASEEGDS